MANPVILPDTVWLVVKYIYLAVLLLFTFFSIIVVRQIHLMTATLNGSIDAPLKIVGYLYLMLVIIVFFLALILL
ncbi:hypothetical protein GYA49_06125 [Candidatus Beckwithbacteria bacterium]|nr:hypothetical protein [Candidatus Beckwithbacteria bacterium]